MNFSILEKYGLYANDIRVYQSLLTLGRSKSGPIAKHAHIVSSSVYESLNNLTRKGLVSFQVRNNVRHYKAEAPDQLIEDMDQSNTQLQKLSKQIHNHQIKKVERNSTDTYEGEYGFKRAFTQHVEQYTTGEKISIISFSVRSTDARKLWPFLKQLNKHTRPKKVSGRILLDKQAWKKDAEKELKAANYEIRSMPSGYFSPSAVNISKREVLLSVWGERPIAFAIRNPTVIQSFQQNFDYLWSKAK